MRARTGLWEPRGGNALGPPGPYAGSGIKFRNLIKALDTGGGHSATMTASR